MFERFTTSAREVVRGAVRQADETGGATVGEPELLLALLDRADSPAAHVLATLGATARRGSIERALAEARRRGGISPADAEALAGLGIDVDAIVSRVEEKHGVGALAAAPRRRRSRGRFAPEAKSVLERSLRIAHGRGDKHIGDEHLLLALLARPGVAANVLADHDVTYVRAERALATRARSA
ncbi:Clp protease N-terminal domain-containing protein [Streptomyces botrytidirepellens]|uniref:Peptidase n=1 Tax=Streptomyces botrytidirepellens TaxID=2486417 RepID=A0A3M8VKL6_9ACTN|nr:Clp protease N-terminal domain-containing protein [Streptomyces botrytidirepellens]RNG18178.1 peptidase [Streptomyces botrytidirepellens]